MSEAAATVNRYGLWTMTLIGAEPCLEKIFLLEGVCVKFFAKKTAVCTGRRGR